MHIQDKGIDVPSYPNHNLCSYLALEPSQFSLRLWQTDMIIVISDVEVMCSDDKKMCLHSIPVTYM